MPIHEAPPLARTLSRPRSSVELDRFRKQLPERAGVRDRDRQDAGEWPEPDRADKHQRPDQRVDAAQRVEHAAYKETQHLAGSSVRGSEQRQRDGDYAGGQRAEKSDRQGFGHAAQEQMQVTAGRGRDHHRDELRQRLQAIADLTDRDAEPPHRKHQRQQHRRRNAEFERTPPGRYRDEVAMAGEDGAGLSGKDRRTGHGAASAGFRWRRMRSVIRSISATVMMISSRIALTSV